MSIPLDNIGHWRCIGPFRGGRVVTVAGHPSEIGTFYFGACAGGVWKTDDAGQYWQNITDGYFKTGSVGALAVSQSDPNIVYAGMGEATIRIDVSHGDGVYKSSDGGRSWQHCGLGDTRHIGKLRIHPQDPDTVFVAALGHAFGRNDQRGVFRSRDGGASWQRVLFVSDKAGAVDLSIDQNNPRIVYASIWEARRDFHTIQSGGEDSGIWRSLDGGDSWQNISSQPGLPAGTLGKIGIAASPAQPGRVYALIEHEQQQGMYRSDDYGDSWIFTARNFDITSRSWYYMHLTACPQDADTVWVNNLRLWKSIDAGKSFAQVGTPHGDNHDLWIDPKNPLRMVQGNDGGACVSLNGGASWSSIFNQPTAQFYRLCTDDRHPYHVYGTQQDNSSIAVPSRSSKSSILWQDCFIAGTGESGFIATKPDDDNIVFVGAIGSSPGGGNALQRYDHASKQLRLVTTMPLQSFGEAANDLQQRFAWTYPILFSPFPPHDLYIGGDRVYKSSDEGASWQAISPDLTRADPATLGISGGPINRDVGAAEVYATVTALAASPHEDGVLWAGSDDGLLHITRDAGESWQNITPPQLPEWSYVHCIEASPQQAGSAYMACLRYKLDDYCPYLYKTADYGQNWQRIDAGIPRDDFTRVIRCDPEREGFLYAGTETGVYFSVDDGESWQSLQLDLPVTPVYDLALKRGDLIAATHGRAFWIFDDVSRLHQCVADSPNADRLLKPRPTQRLLESIDARRLIDQPGKTYMSSTGISAAYTHSKSPENDVERRFLDSGENLPRGLLLTYWLDAQPAAPISLRIEDAAGNTLREFTSLNPASENGKTKPGNVLRIPARAGWNRFVWDMRLPYSPRLDGDDAQFERMPGPTVVPGDYQVTLSIGDFTQTQPIQLLRDATSSASQADLNAQFDLLQQIYATYSEATRAINKLRRLRRQLDALASREDAPQLPAVTEQGRAALRADLLEIERSLFIPGLEAGWAGRVNQGGDLLRRLAGLPSVVGLGEFAPTAQAYAVYEQLATKIAGQLARLESLEIGALADLQAQLLEQGISAVG
ncbi:MAG: glycosyl hydrolase [Chloroflexi bacterium]|nr:glycosyl hydrolase [Chloroflexota bacterium]MXX84496.1 glycosyl hydrolase [Chloroflexota bacterium]MYA94741.1 glycosyl hydrolase [Chloroflexota bacterium]MYH64668.1 glycosyl hydrolase [Chloroflexota bacterium]